MSDSDEKKRGTGDDTRIGGAPPVIPQPPAPPPREATQAAAAPPPVVAATPSEPAAPVAPPPEEAEEEGTVLLGPEAIERRPRVLLNREQPPGHPGSESLDGEQYLIGRSHNCDIKLFSPTASREHARLTRRADGWYIESYENKIVLANGALVRQPTRLEHRMRLQLGGDELVVIDQEAAIRTLPSSPVVPAAPAPPRWTWAALLLALAGALAVAWVLFRG